VLTARQEKNGAVREEFSEGLPPETGLSGSKSGKMGSLRVQPRPLRAATRPIRRSPGEPSVPQTRRFFRIAPVASKLPAWPRAALFGFEFVNEKHT
jgi:hypothetical protein